MIVTKSPHWYPDKVPPVGTEVRLDEDQTPRCKCPAKFYIVVETGERVHLYPDFVGES